jgi:DNA-binding response OmpR family regulator
MTTKIVIADDEPNIVISLEFLMQRNGYEVRTAGDGEAALQLVESFRPDLILLDIMLPLKSGYEVCQKIRENPDLKDTRIVMITAKGRDIEVTKGLALGADAYITKPFSTQDLLTTVKRLLGEAPCA